MSGTRALLFIYGSLKRGQLNHRVIADQEYRGDARTEPRYRVISLGKYGGLGSVSLLTGPGRGG